MWIRLATALAGLLIDKLLLPFVHSLSKRWKRAEFLKQKMEEHKAKIMVNNEAKTKDEAKDTFNNLP